MIPIAQGGETVARRLPADPGRHRIMSVYDRLLVFGAPCAVRESAEGASALPKAMDTATCWRFSRMEGEVRGGTSGSV
jgi:hypothetical protein